ncbi:hypothetical protein V8G54_013066 [Vigna mungo]|uniref:Secreted protein n=1 Tax=Vigna mungo TaxID=3915 RepID=A0AAQ3NTF6_VIGMU
MIRIIVHSWLLFGAFSVALQASRISCIIVEITLGTTPIPRIFLGTRVWLLTTHTLHSTSKIHDPTLGTIPIPRMLPRPCLGTTQTFRVPSIIHEPTSACTKTFMQLYIKFQKVLNFSHLLLNLDINNHNVTHCALAHVEIVTTIS